MSYVIRIGDGRSWSGKILDSNTTWYNTAYDAYNAAKSTNKRIYISHNNKGYVELSLDKLKNLAYKEICNQN